MDGKGKKSRFVIYMCQFPTVNLIIIYCNDVLLKFKKKLKNKGVRDKEFLESNNNGGTTSENLWDIIKVVLNEKIISSVNGHIKRKEQSQINTLMMHLRIILKKQQFNFDNKEMIKIRGKSIQSKIKNKQKTKEQ